MLDYLSQHPHAMDTLEGIAEWWIGPEIGRVEIASLDRALENLTRAGSVERVGHGSGTRYRLKK